MDRKKSSATLEKTILSFLLAILPVPVQNSQYTSSPSTARPTDGQPERDILRDVSTHQAVGHANGEMRACTAVAVTTSVAGICVLVFGRFPRKRAKTQTPTTDVATATAACHGRISQLARPTAWCIGTSCKRSPSNCPFIGQGVDGELVH